MRERSLREEVMADKEKAKSFLKVVAERNVREIS